MQQALRMEPVDAGYAHRRTLPDDEVIDEAARAYILLNALKVTIGMAPIVRAINKRDGTTYLADSVYRCVLKKYETTPEGRLHAAQTLRRKRGRRVLRDQ